MNNDLISRSELKKAINKIIDEEIEIDEKWAKGLKYSLKIIDNAPTVDFEKLGESLRCQIRAEYGSCDDCELSCPRNELIKLLGLARPQGEWIPVSERLPDVSQRYLVYTKQDEVMTDFFMGDEFMQGDDIIAWQPLPKPYKEEGETDG